MKRVPYSCECGGHAFVKVTRGRTALFDVSDIAVVSPWNWSSSATGYPYRAKPKSAGGATVFLHHEIAGRVDGYQVDHINGNGMDNRRANLRQVTKAQNQMNRTAVVAKSGFKGVTPNHNKWMATIKIRVNGNKVQHYLGTFETKELAAEAYDTAARSLFGEYAKTNKELVGASHP